MTNIDNELYCYSNDFQNIYSILTGGMGELHAHGIRKRLQHAFSKMHAKAPICFNFWNFHSVSRTYRSYKSYVFCFVFVFPVSIGLESTHSFQLCERSLLFLYLYFPVTSFNSFSSSPDNKSFQIMKRWTDKHEYKLDFQDYLEL